MGGDGGGGTGGGSDSTSDTSDSIGGISGFSDADFSSFAQGLGADVHGPAVATFGPAAAGDAPFGESNFTGFAPASIGGTQGGGFGDSDFGGFAGGALGGMGGLSGGLGNVGFGEAPSFTATTDAAPGESPGGIGGGPGWGGFGFGGFGGEFGGGTQGAAAASGIGGSPGGGGGDFGGFGVGGVSGVGGPSGAGSFGTGTGGPDGSGGPGGSGSAGIGSDFSASGGIGVGPSVPNSSMARLAAALGAQESNNNYGALGPPVPGRGRAVGRYQVMPENIGPWTQAALGRTMTVTEFRGSPAAQDAVFNHIMQGYIGQYGLEGAIQAWYGGPGAVGRNDRAPQAGVPGPTVGGYTQSILGLMRSAGVDPATFSLGGQGGGPGGGIGSDFATGGGSGPGGGGPGGGTGIGSDFAVGGGLSNAPTDFARGLANVPVARYLSSPVIGPEGPQFVNSDRSPVIGPDPTNLMTAVGAASPQGIGADASRGTLAPGISTPSRADLAGFMPGVPAENTRLGPAPGTIPADRSLAPTAPETGGRGIGSDFVAGGLGDTPDARGPLTAFDPRNNMDMGIFTSPQDANVNNQGWYTEPGGPLHPMAHFLSAGFRDTRPRNPGSFAQSYTDAGMSPEDVYEQMAGFGHVPAPLYPGTFDLNSYGVRPEDRPIFDSPFTSSVGQNQWAQLQPQSQPQPQPQGIFTDFGSNAIPRPQGQPSQGPPGLIPQPLFDDGTQPFNGVQPIPPSHDPRLAPMEGQEHFPGVQPISPNMIPPMGPQGMETIPPELLMQFLRMHG